MMPAHLAQPYPAIETLKLRMKGAHRFHCRTSKMSHDRGWLAGCVVTRWIPNFHFEIREIARGVTAMVVGSGALLGIWVTSPSNSSWRGRFQMSADPASASRISLLQLRAPCKSRRLPVRCLFARLHIRRAGQLHRQQSEFSQSKTSLLPNVKDEPRRHLA